MGRLSAYSKVGIFKKDFYRRVVLKGWVEGFFEPGNEFFATAYRGSVVAKEVYAEVFEMAKRGVYVGKNAFAAVVIGTAQEAYAMEMACDIGYGDPGRDAFVPAFALQGVETFDAATEFYRCRRELPRKGVETVTVHEVGLEPESVYVLGCYDTLYEFNGVVIELHGRARVYDIEHAVFSRNTLEYKAVDLERQGTDILVVVAERALAPTAAAPLQKNEFTAHAGVYE